MIEIKNMKNNPSEYVQLFEHYKEKSLVHRRFKHEDILVLLEKLKPCSAFKIDKIGESFEGRSIHEVVFGEGETKVMLWSQMHGDEATATMALFDLFNFLKGEDIASEELRKLLKRKLKIHFIPMLNPDGAEQFQRRNAEEIDLNRDARATKTIEGALLKNRAEAISPDFGFNLHDQNIYYSFPETRNPIAISLLAPAYNEGREVNSIRANAMALIGSIDAFLQGIIPQQVAKYDDTHSPRGFGDNFQRWGTSTILVESGSTWNDKEKQEIRKYNFVLLLHALQSIAEEEYKNYSLSDYEKIPFNASQLHDLVLRNVEIQAEKGKIFTTDLAIRQEEYTRGRDYYVEGEIFDIGDLADEFGYKDVDVQGCRFVPGKIFTEKRFALAELDTKTVIDLLKRGYVAALVSSEESLKEVLHSFPIALLADDGTSSNFLQYPKPGKSAYFFLSQFGKNRFAVINGFFVDLEKENWSEIKNVVL